MRHVFETHISGPTFPEDPFHTFSPEYQTTHTAVQMRTYVVNNIPSPLGPNPIPPGSISSPRPTGLSSTAIELMGFKKGIKREISATLHLRIRGILIASVKACS